MSLRLRLTLGLGAAFVLLWSLAATWMLYDLRSQLLQSLDERLAASARMQLLSARSTSWTTSIWLQAPPQRPTP